MHTGLEEIAWSQHVGKHERSWYLEQRAKKQNFLYLSAPQLAALLAHGADYGLRCSRRKLSLARNIKCDLCAGRGTKSGKQYPCSVRCLCCCAHMYGVHRTSDSRGLCLAAYAWF